MKRFVCITLTIALVAAAPVSTLPSRRTTIVIGPNIQVSKARESRSHNEVVVASHPTRAHWLVACSMLFPGSDLSLGTAAYVSLDGGTTWSAPELSTTAWADDPTCAFGADSSVYFVHKANARVRSSDTDHLAIHRSTNGGRTWEPEVRGPLAYDRPYMAVDVTAPGLEHLYVAFAGHLHGERETHDLSNFRSTVVLRTSVDGGRTFPGSAERALMDQYPDTLADAGMNGVVVLSDGAPLILYSHDLLGRRNPSTGKPTEYRSVLRLLRSADGGETLGPAVRVVDTKTGYNLPHTRGVAASLAADIGRRGFKDRIYVTWADYTTRRGQILLSYSADSGQSWSVAHAVTDDSASRSVHGGPDHFMPNVAVNRDGVVGVMWYDRRDSPNNRDYHVRFAASRDGGVSWTRSERVSTASNARAQERGGIGRYFHETGGDTAGITASADGRFHVVWVDNRTGVQQVWTAAIAVVP